MKAIGSMATRQVLTDLADAAASAGLPRVHLEAVGGVNAAQRIAAGEQFDLVFLAADALATLAASGHVRPASITPLVRSQVAAGVPSQAAPPAERPDGVAFADAAGVRAALRDAKRIGYSTGPSGTALLRLIDEWGLKDEIGNRLVQARPGVPVAQLLAADEVDLGFQQLSELVGQEGIRILGVLPPDCAIDTVFGGAIAEVAAEPDAARRVLAFLASGGAASIKAAHSFDAP